MPDRRMLKLLSWMCALSMLCAPFRLESSEYSMHVGPNGYPPFVIVEGAGSNVSYSGIVIDLLNDFEVQNPEFSRSYTLLTRKRANAKMQTGGLFDLMFNSPLFISEQILHFYHFTHPLLTSEDIVITRRDRPIDYRKPEDLFGKTVGVIRGFSYGHFDELFATNKINTFVLDKQVQAIGMLRRKRIDAYLGNLHESPYHLRQLGFELSEFSFSEVPIYKFEFGFIVKKDKPNLYKKLNDYIKKVTTDGTLNKLMRSYID